VRQNNFSYTCSSFEKLCDSPIVCGDCYWLILWFQADAILL